MRFSLTAPLRGLLLIAMVLGTTAVGLGRLAPRPTNLRMRMKASCVGINGYHFTKAHCNGLLFDPETGEYSRMALPPGDSLDYAISTPWQDEEGGRQVVGRWVSRSAPEGLSQGFGLGRYAFPSGEVLNRVTLDVMPMGVPCFLPGRAVRVIFAAGDGLLYRLAFEDEEGLPCLSDEEDLHASPLVWRKDLAGDPPMALSDPVWPDTPRLGGRLIVSLTRLVDAGGGQKTRQVELWWLRLDSQARQIIGAGPLHGPDPASTGRSWVEESLPSVGETPEGDLVLAYLLKRERDTGWELRLAPLNIEPRTGNPVMDLAQSVKVGGPRLHTLPIFSGDGCWVFSLPHCLLGPDRPERTPIPTSLRASSEWRRHLALRPAQDAWN